MSGPIRPEKIDALIHEPARLAILSALAVAPELSFKELRETLALTDGNLSVHARTLQEAGYIEIEKSFRDRKPHTAMRLTSRGRAAFRRYLETLQSIIESSSTSPRRKGGRT